MVVNYVFFFFNDTATPEIYTLSLHDALPIWPSSTRVPVGLRPISTWSPTLMFCRRERSEEHTSELQSRFDLVCRLLLEKKKDHKTTSLPAFPINTPNSYLNTLPSSISNSRQR